ncbi:DUF2533 family protein [Niallia circulans]|jgi:hypothetical protein|uniref:DUF2533 family protein n=1 Tax=Niallia circulans TaxID=1397 RepID=UPI003525DFEC
MQELNGEKINSRVNQFKQLDQSRESLIEEAIILCKTGETQISYRANKRIGKTWCHSIRENVT